MKLCGLYLRVSTSIQAQVKDGSLDTQCDILKKYIELKDHTSDEEWRVSSVYREEGKSGKNTDRPEYKRMIKDVKKGKINSIICTKIDRVSRSLMDFYHFHELLEEYDVNFISLNEQWDTSIPMGRFALKITLAAAELEREQTAERIKEKMQWRAEQGLSNGGQILGYDIDEENKGIPKINEEEKNLVILIFQAYLQEQSFLRVAQMINDKGYRSKFYTSRRGNIQGGKKFTNTAIARILQNSYYIGQITHKGQAFDGKHEPIVPIDLWRKAKAIINANRALKRKNRKQNLHIFKLQGLVRCGDCGSFMTPYYGMNRSKKAYFYYICTRKNHLGKSECSMKPVPAGAIEDVVARRLIQLSENKRIITDIVEEATSESSRLLKNYTKTHSNLVKQKIEIEEKIDVLVESIADRKIGIKSISQKIIEFEEVREKLADEILEIEGEIEEIQKKVVNAASLEGSLTTFKEIYEEATPEEQRELMRLHLNQLVWTPEEICLALFDQPHDGMRTNVQRELINGGGNNAFTEHGMIWDKLHIYHQVKSYKTVFFIGEKPEYSIEKRVFRNPLRQALWYQEQIGKEFVGTQTELGRKIGVSRSRIANVLRLIGLEEEIKEFILGIGEEDERIKLILEHKLVPLLDLGREKQLGRFWEMMDVEKLMSPMFLME